jgi:hypothetical protein
MHVRSAAIEHAAHLHDCARELDVLAKSFRTIGGREDGFAYVQTYLPPVDIKGRDDFDVVWPISTDLLVHQPNARAVGRRAVIKAYALNEGACAVANANNGDSYFSHF